MTILTESVDVGDYSKFSMKDSPPTGFASGWSILFNHLLGQNEWPTIYELLLQLGGVVDFRKQETTRYEHVDVHIAPSLKGVHSWQDFWMHDSMSIG